MAIYKSSFNKKPEKKPEKQKKETAQFSDIEPKVKEKPKKHNNKVKPSAVWFLIFVAIFIACVCPSNVVKNVSLGLFGLLIYPLSLMGALFSIAMLKKNKYYIKKRYISLLTCTLLIIWFVFHLILTSKLSTESYWIFIKETYLAKTTAGGIVFSAISYPVVKVLTIVGAYIFSGIALAIFVGLIVDYINTEQANGTAEKKSKFDFSSIEEFNIEEPKTITKEEHQKSLAKRKLGLEKGETTIISTSMPTIEIDTSAIPKKPLTQKELILTPLEPVIPPEKEIKEIKVVTPTNYSNRFQTNTVPPQSSLTEPIQQLKSAEPVAEEIKPIQTKPETFEIHEEPEIELDDEYDDLILDEDEIDDSYETAFETNTTEEDSDYNDVQDCEEETDIDDIFEDLNDEVEPVEEIKVQEIKPNLNTNNFVDEYANTKNDDGFGKTTETEVVLPSAVNISKFNLPNQIKKPVGETVEEKPQEPQKLEIPPYVAPPVELLNYMENPTRITDEELQDNIERLEQVLEDFKVPAKVNNVQVGPAVTRYELSMPRGISVNKIAQMSDDIAMTLAANGAIRVEAPIPGKNSVGIEVPNAQVSPVSLRELVESEEFKMRGNPLSFVLGKDINGDIIFCNLDKMPHLLVAGSTGSGKSVCLNTMLLSMCYKAGPQDLRLILVDPKMVEFTTYNGLPHLLIPEVIIGKDLTINALDWSIKEMERRYALFAKNHVVNINEFNKSELVKSGREQKLPFIVVVVDELADLMLEAKREIEDRIAKLAAKARAAGIHLVLATQRPSVDVITGTVKANLPSRCAFALTNYMDSKTVLDGGGAEKLLGKGDMLFKPQDKPEPRRVQGAYVSNSEIAAVVEFIKQNNKPVYDEGAGKAIKNPHADKPSNNDSGAGARDLEFDPVLKEALHMFIQTKQASGSMISRRFSVGFNRAGRIMDQMERAGFIGPQEGSKPRQVLITMDEFNAIFNEE